MITTYIKWPGKESKVRKSLRNLTTSQLVFGVRRYDSAELASQHLDGYCIVAVFLKEDHNRTNKELEKVGKVLRHIKEVGRAKSTETPVSFHGLLPPEPRTYYCYKGSLTVPDFR